MDTRSGGFTIESVLMLVGIEQRTGELVLESGNNIGSMLFHRGRILQAFSPYTRAIGDLLVEDGVLTDSELIEVLRVQKREPYQPVGSLLMRAGRVSFEMIEMMVHEQIRHAVNVFKKWERISISFVDKNISPYDTIHMPVYEFIENESLKAAVEALNQMINLKNGSSLPR